MYNISTAIVSTLPRTYVDKVVDYFNISVNCIVAYHDAKPIATSGSYAESTWVNGMQCKKAISFWDMNIDILASNAAGIESGACFWGTKDKTGLIHSEYTHAIIRPEEILTLIR